MQQRATLEMMRLRRSTVEHPFDLKRMLNVLGGNRLRTALVS
jgi:hypothetical protein